MSRRPKGKSSDLASRLGIHTQNTKTNTVWARASEQDSSLLKNDPFLTRSGIIDRHSACTMAVPLQASRPQEVGIWRCLRVRQVEFPPAVEADLVCAVFDSEHTAEVAASAAKNKLEYVEPGLHKSCARWRRSQLPLASSQSSRERTLDRAKAIAQSAAP